MGLLREMLGITTVGGLIWAWHTGQLKCLWLGAGSLLALFHVPDPPGYRLEPRAPRGLMPLDCVDALGMDAEPDALHSLNYKLCGGGCSENLWRGGIE